MKLHNATNLHYDLRLEWEGRLLSWALPVGVSYRAGLLREAVEMPDHDSANKRSKACIQQAQSCIGIMAFGYPTLIAPTLASAFARAFCDSSSTVENLKMAGLLEELE